jgi:hypothetical protein
MQIGIGLSMSMGQAVSGGPPASGKLHQSLLTKSTGGLSIGGVLTDQRSGLGTARPIQPGRCLLLNGTDQNVEVAGLGTVGATSLTLVCWFNATGTDPWVSMMRSRPQGEFGTERGWLIQRVSGGGSLSLVFEDSANNFVNVTGGSSLFNGAWHLIVGTFDTSTGTGVMYVDNTQIGTGTDAAMIGGNLDSATGVGYIGSSPTPEQFWPGKLFHAGVIKRVITAAERTAIYSQGLEPWHVVPGQPTDYFRLYYLDDDSQTLSRDASGNAGDGTINNGTAGMLHEGNDVPWSPQNLIGYSD